MVAVLNLNSANRLLLSRVRFREQQKLVQGNFDIRIWHNASGDGRLEGKIHKNNKVVALIFVQPPLDPLNALGHWLRPDWTSHLLCDA
jgi:hypothetical protein